MKLNLRTKPVQLVAAILASMAGLGASTLCAVGWLYEANRRMPHLVRSLSGGAWLAIGCGACIVIGMLAVAAGMVGWWVGSRMVGMQRWSMWKCVLVGGIIGGIPYCMYGLPFDMCRTVEWIWVSSAMCACGALAGAVVWKQLVRSK